MPRALSRPSTGSWPGRVRPGSTPSTRSSTTGSRPRGRPAAERARAGRRIRLTPTPADQRPPIASEQETPMTPIHRPSPATRPTIHGALTALVTPFASDGSIDEDALRRLVRWQVLAGIDGLVPVGTTGESPTLSVAERERVIAITVDTVAERASRGGCRSSPEPARTTPPRRSRPPAGPPSSARMPRSWSRRITTDPTAGCSRPTSPPSPTRATCRSSSTTSRRGPARTSRPTYSCGWPSIRAWSRSRRRAVTSSRSPGSAAIGRATSRSWPATTPGPFRSWPSGGRCRVRGGQ